jgi:hypothetical protein
MRIRSLSATLLFAAGIIATGTLSPLAALAKPAVLHLQLPVGTPCPYGTRPNTSPITVKLLRSDGTTRETRHDNTVSFDWNVCFSHVPVPGDRIRMINGTSEDRTISVPDLTLAVDRVTNVVRGLGPAHKSVAIKYTQCYPATCLGPVIRHATVDGHGRYRKDLTAASIDIDGSDLMEVDYDNSAGDTFLRTTQVPYLQVSKPNQVFAACAPQGATTIRLLTSTGHLRASRTVGAGDDCTGVPTSFRKNGHAVNIHTGDRITSTLASDSRIIWPAISVTGSGSTLSGRCFPSANYVVFIDQGSSNTSWEGTTDSDGQFTGFPIWTFTIGDRLDLICETHQGDRARLIRTL